MVCNNNVFILHHFRDITTLLWPPCVADADIIFSSCGFFCFLLSFCVFLTYSQPSQIGCLPYFHTWCWPSANLGCRSEMCCMRLAENTGCKKLPKIRRLCTITQICRAVSSQLRQYWELEKNLLNSNISSTCPHNMANFGSLTTEICLPVWGIPANFNGFHFLPSLLQWRRSPKANQTFHDVWPSPGLVHYIYTFLGPLAPWRNFASFARCKIHFTSKSCVLLYWQC